MSFEGYPSRTFTQRIDALSTNETSKRRQTGDVHKPVHEHDGSWFFYDETWSDRYGPYSSEKEAEEACSRYAKTLDQPDPR